MGDATMTTTEILGSTMYHEEQGDGPPMVFLHGNPGSSRLWRNVLPAVDAGVRRLAPDLIGMGRSGKPDIEYRFGDHARYLDAWFDRLGLDDVTLVGHDWGGALAFDWAARHPGRVRAVAFLETIVRPMSWGELADGPRARSEAMRGPKGEALVLDGDYFIESAYTGGVLNPLGDEDLRAYLAPYPTRESRRPILQWARSPPGRRARRRHRARRGLRPLAGRQRRRAEAAADVRHLADAVHRPGDGEVVRGQHRGPRGAPLRPRRPPRARGPAGGHRQGAHVLVSRPLKAPPKGGGRGSPFGGIATAANRGPYAA
ncbi:haloalkane dehalogenase [Dactylosporangium darangshiense]|uniref:haloalkane dehalogenase n=1 Tax=Dactylosporangium darangshiense TaxID=579108 RepID=UPI003629265C